jgi:uncharacterized membrane protein
MERIKLFLTTTMMVSFLITIVIGVTELVGYLTTGTFSDLEGWQPLSVIIVGVCTAIATVLFFASDNEKTWKLRVVLHFIIVMVIVMISGYIFNWYHGIAGGAIMFVEFVVVFSLVWIGNLSILKYEENIVNKALEKIRDEE